MNRKISGKTVVLTRCVLTVLGFLAGSLAMWQITDAYPKLIPSGALSYLFYIAAGLVIGLLLALSAKLILHLAYSFGDAMKKAFGRAQRMDIAGVLLGVAIGVMIAYLCEALLSLVLDIISIRVVLDVIVGLAATYIACLACTRALKSDEIEAESEQPKSAGYLLSSSALGQERIVAVCGDWLLGGITVLGKTVNELIAKKDEAALENYRQLSESGRIKEVQTAGSLSEKEELVRYAQEKRLNIIAADADEFAECTTVVKVLALSKL